MGGAIEAERLPAVHWRTYGNETLPTPQEALGQPFAAFPSIRAIFHQRGELSATVELRRLFPSLDAETARESTRTIATREPQSGRQAMPGETAPRQRVVRETAIANSGYSRTLLERASTWSRMVSAAPCIADWARSAAAATDVVNDTRAQQSFPWRMVRLAS
jgi:hypothetical protein